MASTRKAIRQDLAATIAGGVAALATSTFTNRSEAWSYVRQEQGAKPACSVYTLDEDGSESLEAPREYKREVTIAIEILQARADDTTLDDDLDDLVDQVEAVLFLREEAGGNAARATYKGTRFAFDDEGERPMGLARIEWSATYYTEVAEVGPAPGITDFELAHVDWDLKTFDTPEAADDITIPTV